MALNHVTVPVTTNEQADNDCLSTNNRRGYKKNTVTQQLREYHRRSNNSRLSIRKGTPTITVDDEVQALPG